MNARRKKQFRCHQYWQRTLVQRKAINFPAGPESKLCQRCGKPFEPEWREAIGHWSRCCGTCGFRNLCDGLDLPTPPALLDRFTKHPTLTEQEYQRELSKP